MKFVFIIPNFSSSYLFPLRPNVGILYLSSIVKKFGNESVIIDALANKYSKNEIIEIINKEKPDIIGITCLTRFYKEVCELSEIIKETKHKFFIGGVHPTFLPYTTLKDTQADFVICGEGEIPIIELMKNNLNPTNIKGIYSIQDLKNDYTQKNDTPIELADYIENIDEIPFPDWEQVDINKYYIKNTGYISCSRGCPYSCNFCASKNFWKKTRFRSPKNVIDELKYQINTLKINHFQFSDDNLTLYKNYILELCDLIINEKLNITWITQNGIRADKVDKNILLKMKEAGCINVLFGVESASTDILKSIKKNENIEQIKKAINISNECGLKTSASFIFGLPNETIETLEETIKFITNSRLDAIFIQPLTILPGCDLFTEYKELSEKSYGKNYASFPNWFPCDLPPEYIKLAISSAFFRFYTTNPNSLKDFLKFKYIFKLLIKHLKYLIYKFTLKTKRKIKTKY